jgi:hypothetical protein
MICNGSGGKFRWFYTGNQVGAENSTGLENFVAGGPTGVGISAGTVASKFFQDSPNRAVWQDPNVTLNQQVLDASYPFMELVWVVDIFFQDQTFRFSNRNVYVEDEDSTPRFYEARVSKAPVINVTLGEWLNPQFQIGDVTIRLNNRDGYFNDYLPQGENYQSWTGTKVVIKVGFGEKIENFFEVFTGFVSTKKGIESTDEEITLRCYDQYDEDEIAIPAQAFDEASYPFVDEPYKGKPVPYVYGDWENDVKEFGDLQAICTNASEDSPTDYLFYVCDNPLRSLSEIYLHRGDRKEGGPGGAVRFIDAALTKDLDKGQFSIPVGTEVLTEKIDVLKAKAGTGSTTGFIAAESGSFSFIDKGVQVGDTIYNTTPQYASRTIQNIVYQSKPAGSIGNSISITYLGGGSAGSEVVSVSGFNITVTIANGSSSASQIKAAIEGNLAANALVKATTSSGSTPQSTQSILYLQNGQDGAIEGLVTSVTNAQIFTSGTIIFKESDEYIIQSKQYKFVKGDKVSVKCLGKNVRRLSTNRVEDAGVSNPAASGLTLGLDGTYWFADNDAQKIYEISFKNKIVREIDYADLVTGLSGVPAPVEITGLTYQTDDTLWFFDRQYSRVYRYIVEDEVAALSFTTAEVDGISALLDQGYGLTIDSANYLYLVDNATGNFYSINPFGLIQPEVVNTWNITAFEPTAIDIVDLSADLSEDNLVLVDRATMTLYRIDKEDGSIIGTPYLLTDINDDATYPAGVSVGADGTVFYLDRSLKALYNYNELETANDNVGFIARDLIQKMAGKVPDDFDLAFNQSARDDLDQFKCRVYIDEKTTVVTYCSKLLQQFNTSLFLKYGRYCMLHYSFDNMRNDGILIREGDIEEGSFNPSKEYNQYFNSAYADYRDRPFDTSKLQSESYVSISGSTYAGKEVNKKINLTACYRRADVDKLMPLFVRLAAAEPEQINVKVGFRFLFTQLNDFFRVNFDQVTDTKTGRIIKSGRRYSNVPCFTRSAQLDLSDMTLSLKMWSLGTTKFGDYVPPGKTAGGEGDKIVLTSLGTVGYVSPTGVITGGTADTLTIEDVESVEAEDRETDVFGKAWLAGYVIALIDATTHEVVDTGTILSVTGDTIVLEDELSIVPDPSVKNSAGFVTSGHYIRYANYSEATDAQKDNACFFCKPISAYPTTSSVETEEQRAGLHNFSDGRIPYVLHPIDYTPS